jgi:long-chain acyl-CoA synthetase
LGRAHAQQHPDMLTQRSAACKPEELAILVYTSGTTGKPKGGMHSHHGLVFTVRGFNTLIPETSVTSACAFCPVPHCRAHGG